MKILIGSGHLSDEAMLLLHEAALSHREARRAHAHLLTCADCRERGHALLEKEAKLLCSYREEPGRTAQRNLLEMRLAKEVLRQRVSTKPRMLTLLRPRILLRAGMAAVLVSTVFLVRHLADRRGVTIPSYENMGPRPNPKLTPGSVNAVEISQLCEQSDSDLDPRLAPERVQEVYRTYGINRHAAALYQVDYLINPQLGGNDTQANLWPEPYSATAWNATAKDELERHLHRMVCSGDLALAVAQHDIATDWIGAYRKYLHTDQPPPVIASFTTPEAPEE